jgi:hypothetical protein
MIGSVACRDCGDELFQALPNVDVRENEDGDEDEPEPDSDKPGIRSPNGLAPLKRFNYDDFKTRMV